MKGYSNNLVTYEDLLNYAVSQMSLKLSFSNKFIITKTGRKFQLIWSLTSILWGRMDVEFYFQTRGYFFQLSSLLILN